MILRSGNIIKFDQKLSIKFCRLKLQDNFGLAGVKISTYEVTAKSYFGKGVVKRS
jgi:hypothetical protein